MSLLDDIQRARREGNFSALLAAIPASRFMGLSVEPDGDEVITKLAYRDHLIGNTVIGALHGGAIGLLLESAGIFQLFWSAQSDAIPKTITITIEYLRSGRAEDTFARARFVRHGRQIANVRAHAWQRNESEPIAVATMHFLLPGTGGGDQGLASNKTT